MMEEEIELMMQDRWVSPHKVKLRTDLVSQSVIDSFHNRMNIDLVSGCWIWLGGHKGHWKGKKDYGIFGNIAGTGKHYQTAHRLSWLIYNGKIPRGIEVCHKCDNPRCCNPDHLFLGTHQDNMDDMISKGRHRFPIGANVHTNKLMESDVIAIRELIRRGESQNKIAKKFRVSKSAIKHISAGRSWKWLKRE